MHEIVRKLQLTRVRTEDRYIKTVLRKWCLSSNTFSRLKCIMIAKKYLLHNNSLVKYTINKYEKFVVLLYIL